MHRPTARRGTRGPCGLILQAASLAAGALIGCGAATVRGAAGAELTGPRASPGHLTLTIGGPYGRPIAHGFVGLSLEYNTVEPYAGTNPRRPNPVFVRLVRNLAPGQQPVLRIGGNTTDRTWYPMPRRTTPRGVRHVIDRRLTGVLATLARRLDAQLILGINLESGSPSLSGFEARALLRQVGARHVAALELGNEPELYGSIPSYRVHGRRVYGRPHSWALPNYLRDVGRIRSGLPPYPLAGPAIGGKIWSHYTNRIVAAEPGLGIVTLHRFALRQCFTRPHSPLYPSVAHLLAPASTSGLAHSVRDYVAFAHSRGLALRVDEMNSLSCGTETHITPAFVSALWAVRAMFEMAAVGVDGVNVYSNRGAPPALFSFSQTGGRWRAAVAPDYYGLLMFSWAAPPGARLLGVSGTSGELHGWATRAANGTVRVVLVNTSASRSESITLRIPGALRTAFAERLTAPSLLAQTGVSLSGQSFGASTSSGRLVGRRAARSLASHDGRYAVTVAPASASLVTVGG